MLLLNMNRNRKYPHHISTQKRTYYISCNYSNFCTSNNFYACTEEIYFLIMTETDTFGCGYSHNKIYSEKKIIIVTLPSLYVPMFSMNVKISGQNLFIYTIS